MESRRYKDQEVKWGPQVRSSIGTIGAEGGAGEPVRIGRRKQKDKEERRPEIMGPKQRRDEGRRLL